MRVEDSWEMSWFMFFKTGLQWENPWWMSQCISYFESRITFTFRSILVELCQIWSASWKSGDFVLAVTACQSALSYVVLLKFVSCLSSIVKGKPATLGLKDILQVQSCLRSLWQVLKFLFGDEHVKCIFSRHSPCSLVTLWIVQSFEGQEACGAQYLK
jgi:hypothetical protein